MFQLRRHRRIIFFAALFSTLWMSACSDNRSALPIQSGDGVNGPLTLLNTVQFMGQTTGVMQMTMANGALYLSGTPFGFSIWDVTSNPAFNSTNSNPILYSEATNLLQFSPSDRLGGWTPQYYASGALSVFGNYAFSSGTAGLSVINVANSTSAQEVNRYDPPGANGEPVQDLAYVYTSIAAHPTSPILYGFSQTAGYYILNAAALPKLTLSTAVPYSQGKSVCCNAGAVTFNGKMYVAMSSSLVIYGFGSNGALTYQGQVASMQAVGVQASSRYLYVHHRNNGNSSVPTGIYVYDAQGNFRATFPIDPVNFAPSPNDNYLYANMDNSSVSVYQIQ